MTTHYDTLGVPREADAAAIRRAYLVVARRHHPDVVAGADATTRADADRRMREANEAWHVLGDPGRRRAYDRTLDGGDGTDPGFRPFDTGDDPDPLDMADEPYRADPKANSAGRRLATIAPVGLFALGVATFAASVILGSVELVAVSVALVVASGVGFVVLPLLALSRATRDDG